MTRRRPAARVVAVALPGLLAASRLAAQAAVPPTSDLLLLPASTRSVGLAGSAVALNGDAGAIFVNPAGLATIRHVGLEGSLQSFSDGSVLNRGAGAIRLYQFDVGAGYQYLKYAAQNPLNGTLRWSAAAVYRRGMIALGGGMNYTSVEDSAGTINRSLSGAIGLQIAVFDLMALGVSVQDFGDHAISGIGLTLPTTTKVGYMLNFVDPQSSARLLMTIEGVFTAGESGRATVGGEAGFVIKGIGIVIRGGYGKAPPNVRIGEGSAGATLILSRVVSVDYGYQPRAPLGGQLHQFGVRLNL
ncbi:MAG TPA: hypothetical protein VJN95_03830 [Gemmatimonadales bacterium]|nr:hypothetical protein [Gemmatimonadales bacterium]